MPGLPAVACAVPDITPVKDSFPVYEIPSPAGSPLSTINLTDSGNRPAYVSPADKLFGDNMEYSDCSIEAPNPHNTSLLSDLSAEELLELMGSMNLRSFSEGETVVREGEEGHSLYIIRYGKVKVVTRINGEEVVLARLGGDDFFGEVSFLTGRPRTADIITEEPSELMELSRDDLNSVIARHPNIEGVLRLFHENRVSDTLASLKTVARDFLG
jgi:CRP-like cAMP-binding protein